MAGFETLTAELLRIQALWDVALCDILKAIHSFEMSVTTHPTTVSHPKIPYSSVLYINNRK
jgi:hypothetical protein